MRFFYDAGLMREGGETETMLQLQQQKQSSSLAEQVQQLEQRIAWTDDKINKKVYELYGLTVEEMAVIKNKN